MRRNPKNRRNDALSDRKKPVHHEAVIAMSTLHRTKREPTKEPFPATATYMQISLVCPASRTFHARPSDCLSRCLASCRQYTDNTQNHKHETACPKEGTQPRSQTRPNLRSSASPATPGWPPRSDTDKPPEDGSYGLAPGQPHFPPALRQFYFQLQLTFRIGLW